MKSAASLEIRSLIAPAPEIINSMAALWIASWSQTMPAIDFLARRTWFVDRVKQSPLCLLARNANKELLGLMLLDPATGYMDQLAVAPEAMGSGVAVSLLSEAKQICSTMHLDVNEDNPRAVRFYQREGFVVEGYGQNEQSGLETIAMRWPGRMHNP